LDTAEVRHSMPFVLRATQKPITTQHHCLSANNNKLCANLLNRSCPIKSWMIFHITHVQFLFSDTISHKDVQFLSATWHRPYAGPSAARSSLRREHWLKKLSKTVCVRAQCNMQNLPFLPPLKTLTVLTTNVSCLLSLESLLQPDSWPSWRHSLSSLLLWITTWQGRWPNWPKLPIQLQPVETVNQDTKELFLTNDNSCA